MVTDFALDQAHRAGEHEDIDYLLPECPSCMASYEHELVQLGVWVPKSSTVRERTTFDRIDGVMRWFGLFIVLFAIVYFGLHVAAYLLERN